MFDLKKSSIPSCFLIVTVIFMPVTSEGMDTITKEYLTRSGKSLVIEESHPVGQSLSDISLRSVGFEYELTEVINNLDPIKSVHVADLDANGFDEFYIITVSSGSGSYGNVLAFASNKDKSLSLIYFPEIQEGDELYSGYMGHDTFSLSKNRLIRSFPIYQTSDTNNNPTGGTRRIAYKLVAGEAGWLLEISDSAID